MRKIRNTIMLTMIVLTLLPATLIGAYSFYSTSEALRENALIEQQNQLASAQQTIQAAVSRVESDLLFLRDSSAMQLYLSAKKTSGKRSRLLLTNLRNSVQQFAQQQHVYSSVRYLDLSGQEQVRVEKVDGIAVSFDKKDDLLNRQKRDYFEESLKLQSNQIYISPLELRKTGEKLVLPHQATLRYSTVVQDVDNNRQGVLILNLNADSLINSVVAGHKVEKSTITLTDPDGFYYYHPDESKRWSGPNNLKTQLNIFNETELALDTVKNSDKTITSESESMLTLSAPVFLGKDRPMIGYLFNLIPKEKLFKPLKDYLTVSLIIAGVSFLLSLIFAAILANSLSEPLVVLRDSVERLSRGDLETPIASRTKNEIGELSRAVELLRKSMNILMKRSGRPNG